MTTNLSTRISRPAKKIDKPRPLNMPSLLNRSSFNESRTAEEIVGLTELVASNLANGNYDLAVKLNIKNLHNLLKLYGSKLESIYKDQLDRSFVAFRNGSRDDGLDCATRLLLLELIELRAMQWIQPDNVSYYKQKISHDAELVTTPSSDSIYMHSPVFPTNLPLTPLSPIAPVQQLLGPGEIVKSSGKYPAPTRVVGKNYCKDEVVIRNSDSGKVMGIKGRRVHMIEELSETVISFQRVNPGAKERLVQITGPAEDKINFAKQLIEDTIRRNASPVRAEVDIERPASNTSLTDSDDSALYQTCGYKSTLLHSFSTNDASLGEYKYTVTVGDENIKITGTNLDLVRISKLVLDEYFSPDTNEQYLEFASDDGHDIFEHIDTHATAVQLTRDDNAVVSKIDLTKGDSISGSSDELTTPISTPISYSGIRCYTPAQIIHYLDSPLCRVTPEGWSAIRQECPHILRKTPIEWLDAASLLKNRVQDDAVKEGTPGNSPTAMPNPVS